MRVIFLALILLHSFGCSTVVRTTLPFNDLPAPGGPFMVGTGIETWEDTSRLETFTDVPKYLRLVHCSKIKIFLASEQPIIGN